MEINLSTEELITELSIRPLTISQKEEIFDIAKIEISTDDLIDELVDRHLNYLQKADLEELLGLDDCDCDCDEINDFETINLIAELKRRGISVFQADNLLEEQKVTLVNEYINKFKLEELESLFSYGFAKFYQEF